MIKFLRKLAGGVSSDSAKASVATGGSPPVKADDIRFHPSSYADPHGRVFSMQGKIFRGVAAKSMDFYNGMFDAGIVDALVAKRLLIDSKRVNFKVPGYDLVIEHRRVPHVSYPFEWPGEMLRAAALLMLDLLEELATHGLTLKDAHGWNVLFEGYRPIFVDLGSIIKSTGDGQWYPHVEKEFRDFYLHPLELMAVGQGRMARAFLKDFDRGIKLEDCQGVLAHSGIVLPGTETSLAFSWYRERILGLTLHTPSMGWSGYYDGEFPPLEPDATWTPKHRAVYEILKNYRPTTVLDIGANRGWYAMLAAKEGACAVAYDNDEVCVGQLYTDAKRDGLNVQALVLSCLNPTPRFGIGDGVMESATERLASDLILALALVHHMVFKMYLNFDQIAKGLAAYTQRVLVVEFPPATDIHVSQWMNDRYSWYSQENFEHELRNHFRKITVVDSHPKPRVLLICER